MSEIKRGNNVIDFESRKRRLQAERAGERDRKVAMIDARIKDLQAIKRGMLTTVEQDHTQEGIADYLKDSGQIETLIDRGHALSRQAEIPQSQLEEYMNIVWHNEQ